ncbi:MAG: OmpA family protein [Candidatus Hydrogenedentes bacterium]|nr:OmpA family protein [Candidatus Hydrogenedentota bacterium]
MNRNFRHLGVVLTVIAACTVSGGCASTDSPPLQQAAAAPLETEFQDIPFMRYSTALRAEVLPMLEAIRQQLLQHPGHHAHLIGHAFDSLQSRAENQGLAAARVEAVRAWLLQRDVPARQISVESRGDEAAAAGEDAFHDRHRGNRVEIVYTSGGEEEAAPDEVR